MAAHSKTAEISPCGLYRYNLQRVWDDTKYQLPIIMLNPSTADAEVDDPTIRRCMHFAQRENYGGIYVANLFSFRATSPWTLKQFAGDPIGPEGREAITKLLKGAEGYGVPVLCAWGTHGCFNNRDAEVEHQARAVGVNLVCLGYTKHGAPRHPLYVSGLQPFIPYSSGATAK